MSIIEAVLWLALNIYHEARSEPLQGQLAVAHVTLNRMKTRELPLKDVVLQPYQFSWTFQLDNYWPAHPDAFGESVKVAFIALEEDDFTNGATHYHLKSMKVYPDWSSELTYIGQWGAHLFYK